jgi:PhzF family phenazine biosynthesis protein
MGMKLLRIAAFSDADQGGNPAGVVITDSHPDETEMRRIATEVGYSETAFAMPQGDAWRVRYFSPESEVPFALGAALALAHGNGVYRLHLNSADITVSGECHGGQLSAALQSPPTHSEPMPAELLAAVLGLFGYVEDDLDLDIPPARVHGGADHLALCLNSRAALAAMHYELDAGRELMNRENLITILFAYAETPRRFHTRNPFASGGVYEDPATGAATAAFAGYGGVYEDPATGAATAAFAGYLRDLDWAHEGSIEIIQGEDMGIPSRLRAEIPAEAGSSIRVAGTARIMAV